MKFEEVLPALREGKKITCSIIKNSGCQYIYYFDRTIFCGSGSTGKAVMFENRERNKNYKFIGIELEKEYLPIIVARIKYAKYKLKYDEERKQKENGVIQEKLFEW